MPSKNKKEKKQGLALWVMNAILEGSDKSNSEQDSDNEQEQSDSEWWLGPSAILLALSRPPFLILSYLFHWFLFLIEPFFIFFTYRPAQLWNILAYCPIFMTIWLLAISTITSYVKPHKHYGKVRLRWCRTPHSYHIHRYGSSLHMQCMHHLHTCFRAQVPLWTTPVALQWMAQWSNSCFY